MGAALVDYESGMALGTLGGGDWLDLDTAAAGNTEVVRSKLRVISAPTPLPTRRQGAAQHFPPPQDVPRSYPDARAAAQALEAIRGEVDRVNITGLLLASDTQEIEDDSVAAMAAAIGLATRFIG
ncbi:hypothetical protein GCM10017567_43950 [Amycolatopsis bullii]|uniref:Uncharacterized protein n=1 Tax=Amycolatopsis bullii TaxID=941987 RepID=A0ABQ3KG44_9PSEU|nr:hypothetical protein GCM10017567_43950 [Amycolatopsis bullii]